VKSGKTKAQTHYMGQYLVGLGEKGKVTEVDISNYPSGIYFMKIVWLDCSLVMTKIIIE